MALSVHSVFEGLATGLQTDETQLINIVIAILVHKGAAGCSLGIALVKTFPDDMKLCRNLTRNPHFQYNDFISTLSSIVIDGSDFYPQ